MDACVKRSYIWQHVHALEVTENVMAQKAGRSSQEFAQFLLHTGDGNIDINQSVGPFKIALPEHLLLHSNNLADLCHFVFAQLEDNYNNPSWLCSRAIICPTNADVGEVNNFMIEHFPGELKEYKSSDTVAENERQYPIEFLNSLTPSGLPPNRLLLKKHASTMLLRNLDPFNGHVNGARYAIRALHKNIIVAVIATGTHAGKEIYLPRIPIIPSANSYPFEMKQKQFQIRLPFAVTCNKSQGQTFKTIGINLHRTMFSHGQLYVALSRVGSPSHVKFLLNDQATHLTDNVVYAEIY